MVMLMFLSIFWGWLRSRSRSRSSACRRRRISAIQLDAAGTGASGEAVPPVVGVTGAIEIE